MRNLVLLAALYTIAFSGERKKEKTCGPNEEFRECGISCEPKCNEEIPLVCTANCMVNVCQCKEGFKRGPKGCVEPGPDCK
ncbi:hypothetical protein KIN20_024508 [Parelaphostrongylus tenuis]|uniref:TIL domain-containing protein n=1 Tax=Parelaphostrongylus tenuis TaxID=148309 RepID=A0AAD5MTK6_PARTN|nr:hypothetical protein KIN20_024508 [Parelaphostrongylus tenuis]